MSFEFLLILMLVYSRKNCDLRPKHKEIKKKKDFTQIMTKQRQVMDIKISWVDFYFHLYFEPSRKRTRIASMKTLIANLRKETIARVTCGEHKPYLLRSLVLPIISYGAQIWGWDLKSAIGRFLRKGTRIHMMPHIKLGSLTFYHILLVEFGEHYME